MHTKQWLSSEQSNIAIHGLLGCGGTWLFGVSYGGINISSRIKQSFYPRTRHGELKVISMIYAPPYLTRRRAEGEVERSRTRNVSEHSRRSTHEGKHWKAIKGAPLSLRRNTRSRRHHTTRQRGTDLSS